jgi:hypothetical protein
VAHSIIERGLEAAGRSVLEPRELESAVLAASSAANESEEVKKNGQTSHQAEACGRLKCPRFQRRQIFTTTAAAAVSAPGSSGFHLAVVWGPLAASAIAARRP